MSKVSQNRSPASKQQRSTDESAKDNLILTTKMQKNGSLLSSDKTNNNNTTLSGSSDSDAKHVPNIKVSNIIGDFGPYQIAVVIFAALRALCCAMDGLSGPFLSPNIRHYQCEECDISTSPYIGQATSSNITKEGICNLYSANNLLARYEIDSHQCFFTDIDSPRPNQRIYCKRWSFNSTGNEGLINSLTAEQSLVCDREKLKSVSNSLYFIGALFGLLFWGFISDKYGRKTAYVCSHFVTLTFGFSSLFAESMSTYILLRSINAFGMIGELIPRSIQVEIVATEYRYICSVVCQIGWATGILLVPATAYINPSYKFILSVPVLISAIMLPWLIWLPESARWLIINNKFEKAKSELKRAAKINGKLSDDIDMKIEQFNHQVLREETGNGKRIMGMGQSMLAIFTNPHLSKDTRSVFVLLFVAEVVYFSLTLNLSDLGGSLYLNSIISGLSEYISIAFCAVLLAYLSRRMCLSLLLLASTVSYLLMALVNVYEDSLSMTLILAVNAFGKLTAIGNLMVIILVSQEVFPTVIRQFGTSLCITVGKAGSAVAPFTHELGQVIGQSYCFAMFSVICLLCAIIPFGLSETGNRELPDTVIDVEEGANDAERRRKLKKSNKEVPKNYIAHYESTKSTTRIQPFADHNSSANGYGGGQKPSIKSGLDDAVNYQKKQNMMSEDLNNNSLEKDNNTGIDQPLKPDHNATFSPDRPNNNHRSLSNLSSTFGRSTDEGSQSDISFVETMNSQNNKNS